MMNHKNIGELTDWLKSTHVVGDLYRGQQRDYPVMLPSFFRSLAVDLRLRGSIAPIDEQRFHDRTDQRFWSKFRCMNTLIGDLGIGLGNIVAQQYGLSSEAIDVTESIDVAAYFATRQYPAYSHVPGPGMGVIYRFRGVSSDGLASTYDLSNLSGHFEAGMSEHGYFDFFVRLDEMERVFERDRWWEHQPPREAAEAWTPRFVTSWSQLSSALMRAGGGFPTRNVEYRPPYERQFDWRLTRFESQSGGLIRPRLYWHSSTPSQFEVASTPEEAYEIRMRHVVGPPFQAGAHGLKWPLVIPSAAIKRGMVGVENIREHPGCEAHLFEHSEQRVTGFYRRLLWPEPSEDPLFGKLWQLGLSVINPHWDPAMPGVDDPEQGVLDRGYILANEAVATNGRDDRDLRRGQLEDALENRQHGPARAIDHAYQASVILTEGDPRAVVSIAIAGLRIDSSNVDLLLALYEAFSRVGKPRWAHRVLDRGLAIAPEHSWLLYKKAMELTRESQIEPAIELIDRAIANYDETKIRTPDFHLLELRAVLAYCQWDTARAESILRQLRARGFTTFTVMPQVQWLWKQFPQLQNPPQRQSD